MSITFNSSSYAHALSSSVTCDKPSDVVDGTIMLALAWAYNNSSVPTGITAPTGWTSIADKALPSLCRGSIFWKRASSEGASYTFTGTDAIKMSAEIVAFDGCVSTGSPINTYSNTAYTTSDKILRAAGVTTTVADAMLVILGASFSYISGPTSAKPPSGFTEHVDNYSSAVWELIYAASAIQSTAGASGDKDVTLSGSASNKHAFLVALKPAAAASTVFLPHIMCHHTIPPFIGGH